MMSSSINKRDEIAEYTVLASTNGTHKHAKGNSSVHIDMIGEENGSSTGWKKLCSNPKNYFKPGKTDEFKIKARDIGLPLIIRLELHHDKTPVRWACDTIVVLHGELEAVFPIYDWVDQETCILRGEALIRSKVQNLTVKSMLTREVEQSKVKFQWISRPNKGDIGWKLPRYVNVSKFSELPRIFQSTEICEESFIKKEIEALGNKIRSSFEALFSKHNNLESYKKLYKHLPDKEDPIFINRWKTDAEFGRQQLVGITPTSVSRCTTLPLCCQISSEHVSGIISNGNSLEDEMQKGRIFIADYSEVFQGVTRNFNSNGEQLYCPDAICLYYASPDNGFVPIAIQLVPDDPETIFTPNDSHDDWLLAKMYFKVAMSNMHEWYYHFMMTHDAMEPFAVSLFRCFPRSHPVYKLLRPHLQTVSVINTMARKSLIRKGSMANKGLALEGEDLARHMFRRFKMDDLIIHKVLRERGLDDKEILPKNYYRDDALSLWDIIEKFVSDVIGHFYPDDQEVLADEEIQDFAKDVANEGLGWQEGNTRGMDSKIQDVKSLVCLCTTIIFTSSVQHAAVNFPQYETYKYVPNSPTAMRLPPHKRGEATMERIMKSLPDVDMATTAITITYTLSAFSPDEICLGNYPMKLFTDPAVLGFIEDYKKALNSFSEKVEERNKLAGEDAYHYLLPKRVPNSIAI